MQHLNRSLLFCLLLLSSIGLRAQSLAWVKTIGANDSPLQTNGMATDAAGNTYLTGAFTGTADFDPGPGTVNLTAAGGLDIFFAKYNPDGSLAWAQRIGGSGVDRGNGIAVDAAGNVFVTGNFRGTVDLDPGPGVLNATATPGGFDPLDMFIAKYSSSGAMLWTKLITGTGQEYSEDLATDASGNVVLSAQLDGVPTDYDPGPGVYTLSATNGGQTALLKLDPSGNFIWARQIGEGGSAFPDKMRTDASGAVYLSGYFNHTVDFDPGPSSFPLSSSDASPDAYLLKLAPDGSFVWATMAGGYDYQDVYDFAIDASGAVYATGFFKDNTDFDPGPAYAIPAWQGDREAFLWKINPTGTFAWVHSFASTGNGVEQGLAVDVDANGYVFLLGQFAGTVDFDPDADVQSLDAANGNSFIGKFSPAGDLVWVRQIGGTQPADGKLRCYAPDAFVVAGLLTGTADFDPGPGVQTVTPTAAATAFIWKLASSNQITGTVFLDTNGDGIRQPAEAGAPTLVTALRNGITYVTEADTNGFYRLTVDPGTYTVTVPLPAHYSAVLPAQQTVSFAGNGGIDTAHHFALQPVAGVNDLAVWLSAESPARANRSTYYVLRYQNRGTLPISGTVRVQADPHVQFESATPAAATNSGAVQGWNFSNLAPMRSGRIYLQYLPAIGTASGTRLQYVGTIDPLAGDALPADNSDTLVHTVTASLDPNDKSVTPAGDIPPSFVAGGNYLDYTVRFQNTGNDTAFVVVLRDTLSALVDPASFQMVAASHPYRLQLGKDRDLEWTFDNIALPDSNVNEARSHGFVRYRVKALPTAAANDVIRNRASIYFDFNTPVGTNETATRITVLTALPGLPDGVTLRVYPVPAHDALRIECGGSFSWRLYSTGGSSLREGSRARDAVQVPLGGLPAGSYWLEVRTPRGRALRKVLVQ